MRILVTGADGYLGALLSEQLEKTHEIVRTSRNTGSDARTSRLDVTDRSLTMARIDEEKPNVIVHAAAIANVATCEARPEDAAHTNVGGTENVVDAANSCAARVILISSLAARDPSTVYGRTKRRAEECVEAVDAGHEILQLSMTFGLSPNRASHRPFNKILSTYRTGSPDTYDSSWQFQPTDAHHLLDVLHELLRRPFRGRVLPITTVERCTMHQIASDVLAPKRVKAAALHPGRIAQIAAPSELTEEGFASSTYDSLVRRLREQLSRGA